jgi:hypothetical protein
VKLNPQNSAELVKSLVRKFAYTQRIRSSRFKSMNSSGKGAEIIEKRFSVSSVKIYQSSPLRILEFLKIPEFLFETLVRHIF